MNKIIILVTTLFILSCKSDSTKIESNCENYYSDKNMDFCLPSNNWKSEKIDKYLIFKNDSDSLKINNSIISIMIDDYQSQLSAETLRDKHLESMKNSKTLNIETISKGTTRINGEKFYDFEIYSKNREVYSYFLFYNKGDFGYTISASIGEKIRNGIDKKDYLNLFSSLRIK